MYTAAVGWRWWDELLGRPPRLDPVNVTLRSGGVVRGALVRRHADAMVLDHAAVAGQDANGQIVWTMLDGQVVILHENVEFWQRGLDAEILETRLQQ